MLKVKAVLFSLVPFLVIFSISIFIYASFQSTPALLLVFFLTLLSFVVSIRVYKRMMNRSGEKVKHVETDLPRIENDLIYIDVESFAEKFSKEKGILYLAGEKVVNDKTNLEAVSYDKLTDELEIRFSSRIKINAKGMQNIGVGDKQVCLFFFEKLTVKVGNRSRYFSMHKKELYEHRGEEKSHVIFTHSIPPLVFHW
mgnify:CR=1 FL=1